jgi:hypothetical protein
MMSKITIEKLSEKKLKKEELKNSQSGKKKFQDFPELIMKMKNA